jgi:hemolysin activation/secretion protein
VMMAGTVWAQNNGPSPGQLVPKTLPPEATSPPSMAVPVPERPSDIDTEVADLDLTVSRFTLADAGPTLAALAERKLGPLRAHKVRVDAIYAAIAELEQTYVDQGHFLTRIMIPPQHVADRGELHLQVIHGFIQWLDLDEVPEAVRVRVSSILTPLVNNPRITRAQFERALLIASDLPGLTLRATLRAGPEVGAVILVVAGNTQNDHGSFAIDNTLPKLLGGTSGTLSSAYTAPSGTIDQLYFTGSAPVTSNPVGSDSPRSLLVGGLRSAVGVNGAALDANLTWSRTKPKSSPGVLDTDSTFDRAALRGTYPLIKTRATTLLADVAFDATAEQENATQFGKTLYDDQLRAVRAGISAIEVFDVAWQAAAGVDLSKGLHLLGARGPKDASAADPLSQQGASDVFTKFEWHASLHRQRPAAMGLDLQVRGQQVNRPLLLSEKFTLGGPADLSAYDTASFSGDRGWAVRAELQRHLDWHVRSVSTGAQAYLFGAHGEVVMTLPTAAERRTSAGSSAGLGVRTSSASSGTSVGPLEFTGEVAREFNPAAADLADYWRLHVALTVHF